MNTSIKLQAVKINDGLYIFIQINYSFFNFFCLGFKLQWMVEHPGFKSNQLYIGGDSYSGITVPLIVQEILDGKLCLILNDCFTLDHILYRILLM
jgi:hypothetical protein